MKDCVLRGTGTLGLEQLEETAALRNTSCEQEKMMGRNRTSEWTDNQNNCISEPH